MSTFVSCSLTKLKYILTELALEIIDDDQGVLFEASSGKTLKQVAELIQKNENHPAKDNFLVQEIVNSKVQPTQ